MSDEVGGGLMAALSENRPQRSNWDKAKGAVGTGNLKSGLPQPRTLTKLDLSRNKLGPKFAAAVAAGLSSCPALATLDLSYNSLGVEGGKALALGLTTAGPKGGCNTSMKTLDVSFNNLCNLDLVASSDKAAAAMSRGECSTEAVSAMCEALLAGVSITELSLHGNGLCGLWPEHVCGEPSSRGSYTTTAVDTIIGALERERLSVKPTKEGFKVDLIVKHDFMRKADERRLLAALKLNGRKPVKVLGGERRNSTSPERAKSPGIGGGGAEMTPESGAASEDATGKRKPSPKTGKPLPLEGLSAQAVDLVKPGKTGGPKATPMNAGLMESERRPFAGDITERPNGSGGAAGENGADDDEEEDGNDDGVIGGAPAASDTSPMPPAASRKGPCSKAERQQGRR